MYTSYVDVLKITPTERRYLLEFLEDDAKAQKEAIDKAKNKRKQ